MIIAAFQEKDGPETGWIMPEPMIQRANQVFLFLFHWVQYPAPRTGFALYSGFPILRCLWRAVYFT
ncbi:MAG: hypothetical protein J6M38_10660, partial [Lentisphaeria bacterium]|nr:hypothetical protein [Lentisphaeria bacterium]